MSNPKVSEAEFIDAWRRLGSPAAVARELGVDIRNIYARRDRLEKKGHVLSTTSEKAKTAVKIKSFDQRRPISVKDGTVIVFSDAHFWPGDPSIAYYALLEAIRVLKPKAIIANGDIMDAPTISRHEPRGWMKQPTVAEEVFCIQERLNEIEKAAKRCELMRTLGNHDIRFERHLAVHAPQYRGLAGTSLEDHIPKWPCSWTVEINGHVMVKHRHANGLHATYNNTLRSGRTMVTGHLHALNVRAWTDYNGTRYGVDTGTLADPDHEAFDYREDGPADWRSGFAVLTFRKGKLLWPELCYVDSGAAYFRGEAIA